MIRHRYWGAVLGVVLLACAGCGDSDDAPPGVKVMTLNAYYGFDVGPLMEAGAPEEIPLLALEAFLQLQRTDFAGRAEAMADKIAAENPDLIGLQEVALIRYQSPGDAVAGGAAPAEDVIYDHLAILLDALAARGLDYRVAGSVQNIDIELPMIVDETPSFDDIRLTDRDVVLARADVEVSNVTAATFAARAFLPSLGLEIPRGYVALDARVGGSASVRFVSTHLEDLPFEDVQIAQAKELVSSLAGETQPVILVGDFNSPAPGGATVSLLESEGFEDAWRKSGDGAGLTWGHDAELIAPAPDFSMRIDLVFSRSRPTLARPLRAVPVSAEVWGDDEDERTDGGLWPSDHASVVAELELRP